MLDHVAFLCREPKQIYKFDSSLRRFCVARLDVFADEVRFNFGGEIFLVRTQEGAEAAVSKLRLAKVVGFDMEWYAPRVRGVGPSRTAVIQICSSPDFCALFAMCYFDELPPCLKDFLCDAQILKVRTICSTRVLFFSRVGRETE